MNCLLVEGQKYVLANTGVARGDLKMLKKKIREVQVIKYSFKILIKDKGFLKMDVKDYSRYFPLLNNRIFVQY